MRVLQRLTIILFLLILFVPAAAFNFEEEAISEIDNRMLAANPFSGSIPKSGDLTDAVENYVNDRIGFRDEMILIYTVLNDRIFGKMVHPGYSYGKNGYVFGAGLSREKYGEFHETFAGMVSRIQEYCEARSVPFLFVFNPAKTSVLTEYLPNGIQYDHSWVDAFLADLDKRGVHYIDNTVLMREKTENGEYVYNIKYDANHWNDLGGYYGTNNILMVMRESIPGVHINEKEEIIVRERLQTSLPVSRFPIHEMVPQITLDTEYEDIGENYRDELILDRVFSVFGYYINEEQRKKGAPRALVFQGSYMNNYGTQYMINGFGEYIHVHDYQNVIHFPYYFNIFKPDCVIFEVAEYTLSDTYFDLDHMKAMDLNPVLDEKWLENRSTIKADLDSENLTIEKGRILTRISWDTANPGGYAWLRLGDNVYDFSRIKTGFEVTVTTKDYRDREDEMEIILSQDREMKITDEEQ